MINKMIRRSLALILVFSLLIQVMPVSALASHIVSNQNNIAREDLAITRNDKQVLSCTDILSASDENIICEIPELREQSVKHFRLSDGSMVAAIYDVPVHEQQDDGTWKEIDNSITSAIDEDGKDVLSNGNRVSFAKKAKDGKLLTINTNYGKIKWNLNGISGKCEAAAYSEPEIEANNTKMAAKSISGIIIYKDIIKDVDLEYCMIANDIKENIILHSSSAAQSFSFTLDVGKKMTAELENNTVIIRNQENEIVRTISAPYMTDAEGETSNEITVSLSNNHKDYTVTISPDLDWLCDEERSYPVIIDPTIVDQKLGSEIANTSVYSASPTSSSMYSYGCTYVGREASAYGNLRGAIKFTLPSTLKESDMVISASLKLTQRNYYGQTNGIRINLHRITSNLGISSLTWNKLKGKYDSTVLDNQVVNPSTVGKNIYWDITAAVKSWYLEGNNYGLALVSTTENSTYKYATFYTDYPGASNSLQPAVVISYLNHDGIEDYLTYHYAGDSSMGSIAVGDFNGNLLYTYTDLAMTGNYIPVTIQHVYNHSQRDKANLAGSNMSFGYGMKLNLSQRIDKSTVSGYPYKYTDADGTVHYFSQKKDKNGNKVTDVYEKEYDSSTLLIKTSDGYTLTSNDSFEYRFDAEGILSSVHDTSNGKTMSLAYTDGKLTSVTDGAGRNTLLSYDTNNYLTGITDPSGRTTAYSYTDGCLSQITKPDGTTVSLNYTLDGSVYLLTEIVDVDSSKVAITYHTKSPRRVASITEYGTNGTEGGMLTWTYTAGETTVTDRDGRSETMMFDNFGHTVCICDGEGNAVYGKYANTSDDNKHSLNYQSQMERTVTNYLTNHNFENGYANWTSFGSGSTAAHPDDGEYGDSLAVISDAQNSEHGIYQQVSIPDAPGRTITFSAYLKLGSYDTGYVSDNTGIFMGIEYQNSSGEWVSEEVGPYLHTGWQRHSISVTIPEDTAGSTVRVFASSKDMVGTFYIDCAQLEPGAVANRYNIIENGHFAEATGATKVAGWTNMRTSTSTDKTVAGREGSGFYIKAVPANSIYLYQDIKIPGSEGDTFVVGGWGKGSPVAFISRNPDTERYFGIQIKFYTDSENSENEVLCFEAKSRNWQYLTGTVTAPCDYQFIRILIWYRFQSNSCTFDDIQLHRDEYGTRYEYDDTGRVTSVTDSMGRTTTYEYAAEGRDEISKITYSDGTTSTFSYDTTTWKLLSSSDANGKTATYNYDENGNSVGSTVTVDGLTMGSAVSEYSGSYMLSSTDVLGNTIEYDYDPLKGTLNKVIDPAGADTNYTYNAHNDALTGVQASGSEVDYTYSSDKLVTITHNTDSNSENDVIYNFVYDEFGNTSSVAVGSQALISHTYEANNGMLSRSDYGNGDYYVPTYDSLDRITAVSYNGVEKYNWAYGADGKVGLHNDLVNDVTWRYEYTKDGSLTSAYASNGERFDYAYDTATGKLISVVISDGTTSKTITYNYSDHTNGEDANLIESVVLPTGTVEYSYDGFYRASYDVNVSSTDILATDFTFASGVGENSTTTIVESMTTSGSDWSYTLSYTYDCKGNIETISENGEQKARYYYDSLDQLIREDNAWLDKTITYTYDNGGNIQSVSEYALTSASDLSAAVASATDVYAYEDSSWKDKLTSYNGSAITYDEIGNPLSYYNGYTFDWQNGRQLASITGNGKTISYTYNADGIRTSKTVNGVATEYTLDGSNVVVETNGTDTIWYYYDATGTLTGFELNGTPYFYVKSVQGDIVAITDASGTKVVEYLYDSWGKLISTTGSLAITVGAKNPYRYRGYRYDTETGLYYLQSRYYDPEIGRFINADGYVSTGQGLLGTNMFVYCGSNSVNRVDNTGQFWKELWDAFTQTIQQASGYFAAAVGVSQVDTPVPGPADVVSGVLLLGGILVCAGIATYTAITAPTPSISIPNAEEKEEVIAIPTEPDNPVIFPVDPNAFNPVGLVKVSRSGTKNGAFICWMDPLTNTEVFRWDENPNYSNGPHYHIHGTGHYYPGSIVPEPYASMYFPSR